MKKITFVLLFFTVVANLFAQFAQQQLATRQQSLYSLVQESNRMMEIYDTFKPGGVVFHSIKDLEFKDYEVTKIQTDDYLANFLSREKDSIAVFAAIELFQDKIAESFRQIVSHRDFARSNIQRQILSELKGVKVTISEDNRLFNFAFDAKSGGSYQMQTSAMHYIRPVQSSGSGLSSWSSNNARTERISPKAYLVFSKDGYSDIVLLNKEQSQYLLIGQVRTDVNSYECYADLVSFKDGVFVKNFEFRVQTNNPQNCIVFDPATKNLTVRYKTNKCDCTRLGNASEKLTAQSKICECIFRFNGTTFVKK